LPGISETAKIFAGVDTTKAPIPVTPTVHYNMGGVPTNYHAEVVSPRNGDLEAVVPGLMAIGEGACVSVHGANRLGTNSLLDLVVFGRAAALRAQSLIKPNTPLRSLPKGAGEQSFARLDRLRHAKGTLKTSAIRLQMQKTMQAHCSVFRRQDILAAGLTKMQEIHTSLQDIALFDRSLIWNSDLMEALELENLIGQSLVTLASALARQESRGGHARDDYPKREDQKWLKHTLDWVDGKGEIKLEYRPVHMYTLTDEVEVVPLQERVY